MARGLTYGVIGGIALALAVGAGTRAGTPNQQGALRLIARAPLGGFFLGLVALGLLAYALWKLSLATFGYGPEGGGGRGLKDRGANLVGGIAYLALFTLSLRVLLGDAGNESSQQRRAAAGVLGWPGGRFLVAAAGGCLLAASVYQVYAAARRTFNRGKKVSEMDRGTRRLFDVVAPVGLGARAVVFGLVGYFLIATAVNFTPATGIGVDGSLADLHRQPFGAPLLATLALGLMIFAAFSFFEARYQQL